MQPASTDLRLKEFPAASILALESLISLFTEVAPFVRLPAMAALMRRRRDFGPPTRTLLAELNFALWTLEADLFERCMMIGAGPSKMLLHMLSILARASDLL